MLHNTTPVSNHRLGDVAKDFAASSGKVDVKFILDLAHDICHTASNSRLRMQIGFSGETVMLFHPDYPDRVVQLYQLKGVPRMSAVDSREGWVESGTYPLGVSYKGKGVQAYVNDYPEHIADWVKGYNDELIVKDRWSEGGLRND